MLGIFIPTVCLLRIQCAPIPSIVPSSLQSISQLLANATYNSQQQYNLSSALVKDSSRIFEHVPLLEDMTDPKTQAFSPRNLHIDFIHETHTRFSMLNIAMLQVSLDLASSAHLAEQTISLISYLTTNTSLVLSSSPSTNLTNTTAPRDEPPMRLGVFAKWAKEVAQIVDTTTKTMEKRDLEGRLRRIKQLAKESGFRTPLASWEFEIRWTGFVKRMEDKIGHDGWKHFKEGHPTWERLAACDQAISVVQERKALWKKIRDMVGNMKGQVDRREWWWWKWWCMRGKEEQWIGQIQAWNNISQALGGIVTRELVKAQEVYLK
jgi:hypothetical protein